MSKLKTLKSWLTLDEAAEYLTEALKEHVAAKDLLQLAFEDQLQLAWFANNSPATDYLGDCYRVFNALLEPDYSQHKLDFLTGPFRVASGQNSFFKNWLHRMIMGVESHASEISSGFFVNDSDGSTKQILGILRTGYRDINGSVVVEDVPKDAPNNQPKKYIRYYLAISEKDIVVITSDIQEFVERCTNPKTNNRQSDSSGVHSRERDTLLTIIGALIERTLGKTPSGRKISEYKTQSAIIDDLLAHFPDQPGLSQRTLEEKFAEAKKRLPKR